MSGGSSVASPLLSTIAIAVVSPCSRAALGFQRSNERGSRLGEEAAEEKWRKL